MVIQRLSRQMSSNLTIEEDEGAVQGGIRFRAALFHARNDAGDLRLRLVEGSLCLRYLLGHLCPLTRLVELSVMPLIEAILQGARLLLDRLASLIEELVAFLNFFGRPLDGVDLLAQQTEETKLVGRSLFLGYHAGCRPDVTVTCLYVNVLLLGSSSASFELRRLAQQLRFGDLQLVAGVQTTLIDVREFAQIPIDPNVLDATGKILEHLAQALLAEVLRGYAGDQDGVCLRGLGMGRADKILLPLDRKVAHLGLDVVQNPD